MTYENVQGKYRGRFVVINRFIKKEEKSQIYKLTLQPMELEKEMKINPNQPKGGNKKDYNRDR